MKTEKYLVRLMLILSFGLIASVHADLTREQKDSGWVELFNGKDLEGLTVKISGQNEGVYPDDQFSVVNGNLSIKGDGERGGVIRTDKQFSHYRARVEYRFEDEEGNQNTGYLHHVQDRYPDGWSEAFPTSMELQGHIKTAGMLWAIGLICNSTVKPGTNRFQEGGENYDVLGLTNMVPGRLIQAPEVFYQKGQWNTLEVYAWGADSAHHRVNGNLSFKGTRIRTAVEFTDESRVDVGGLALQSEGADLNYRRWMILEFDSLTREPKKPWGCGDKTHAAYDPAVTQHDDFYCENAAAVHRKKRAEHLNISARAGGLVIYNPYHSDYAVKIYSLSGALLRRVSNHAGQKVILLNPGLYLVEITTQAGIETKKIMVK